MDLFSAIQLTEVVSTIFYTFLGVILMSIFWWIINVMTPFSVIKEIEEDQNISLAILIGSVFVALSIIIAAVILS
ncbi:DUF350 domain-containing protein [Primorskyibacter sp. 2E233]|uniref:DUF350 domain-containing protein n=1 Tax=Primorskyibacter sp. 2E233 TaxID=3413431 RepID=UPI003BF09861